MLRLFGYLPRGKQARKLRPTDLALSGEDFAVSWRRAFGDAAPAGWQLRQTYPDRWTRFHTLEQSKRYPETMTEKAAVLARVNAVGSACFETERHIWLVVFDHALANLKTHAAAAALPFTPAQGASGAEGEDAEQVFAARVTWQDQAFDWLIEKIAEDEVRALFFDPQTQTAFAPYDGGVDVFLAGADDVARLEGQFRDWMSKRDDKL